MLNFSIVESWHRRCYIRRFSISWGVIAFGYSRDAGYLKISAATVYENLQKFLPTIGRQIPLPTNERQVRSLAKAELEPAVQADVWQQAVEQCDSL
ncbi:hypothetical protein ACEYW6_33080, partial [Nostoc sp. UIC 10607]